MDIVAGAVTEQGPKFIDATLWLQRSCRVHP